MANQAGPGGPGGDSYDPNKNDPVVTYTSPGYTGSGSQSGNQGNQGAGQSAPSAAPTAEEIANTESIKTLLKKKLEGIVDNKGGQGSETSGLAGQTISGQNKDGQNVSIVIPANVPPKFHQFLINNAGTQAAASILNNYAASGVNPYQYQIENFKNLPGGIGVFKDMFPNPLVNIGKGIGNFFKKGTLLGKFLSGLSKSDQNKLKTIQNEHGGVKIGPPAYDVNQYGLGNVYDDRILRDQLGTSFTGNPYDQMYGLPMADLTGAGPRPDNSMFSADLAYKKKIVDKFLGTNNSITTPDKINLAYDYVMRKYEKDFDRGVPSEASMMGASSPDYSNFQDEIVDEVVDDRYQAGPNEDNMMGSENIFEIGSGNLAGSVSETDYTAPNIEGTNPRGEVSSARSTPLIGGDPNVPYGYEENILDVLAEDNFANGGYNYINGDTMNSQSLTASANIDDRIMKNLQYEKMAPGMMGYNTGGYAGMSTFDKLKMIADSGYQS